jgi:hypothetical protein
MKGRETASLNSAPRKYFADIRESQLLTKPGKRRLGDD